MQPGVRIEGTSKLQGRKSYRSRSSLPKLLPDWWEDRDADSDGQVMLNEFSNRPSADSVREFSRWDRNGDGVITTKEALAKQR